MSCNRATGKTRRSMGGYSILPKERRRMVKQQIIYKQKEEVTIIATSFNFTMAGATGIEPVRVRVGTGSAVLHTTIAFATN